MDLYSNFIFYKVSNYSIDAKFFKISDWSIHRALEMSWCCLVLACSESGVLATHDWTWECTQPWAISLRNDQVWPFHETRSHLTTSEGLGCEFVVSKGCVLFASLGSWWIAPKDRTNWRRFPACIEGGFSAVHWWSRANVALSLGHLRIYVTCRMGASY